MFPTGMCCCGSTRKGSRVGIAVRILMLAQFYPPIVGGIERHVSSLGAALAARGHAVSVATLWHPGQSEFEMDGAVAIYRIHGFVQRFARLYTTERKHSPPFPDPEAMLALRRVISHVRPEIIHAHNWMVYSFLPLKERGRAKLVVTLHDCGMTCVQMRMMYRDTELCSGPEFAKCLRCSVHHYGFLKGAITLLGNGVMNGFERSRVDMFLPVSHAIADANRLTGTNVPFQVVPNFVPDDVAAVQDQADPRLSQLPQDGFILQVGDLARDKGIGVLLDAYAGLASPPPLVVIGRRLAESPTAFPPNVTVIEGWPHALVMLAWRRSLFGTVPSMCLDACPTVTLEAMASGRPIVGSCIGGVVDQIVDGETGFLVPPGDVAALRQAMARLSADPALRVCMGEAAKRKVVEFQSSVVVSQIEQVYRSL
jgi:glycosyltransferase involved in cell wall biosynthesis